MPLVLATTTPGEPEIFASIQGEGPSSGRPCAFVRLSRCNLACQWCDTPYTWHFTGDERPHRGGETFERTENQITLAEDDVAARIATLRQDRLVITGGEPLLQSAALIRMLEHLPGMTIEVETNGSVRPSRGIDALVDQYNVSPKLSHSGNPAGLALPPERLAAWAAEPRAFLKFVVATPEDAGEALALADRYRIPRERMLLMAEGTSPQVLDAREEWLAPLCTAHNLTLSRRLHIHLFGDTRGT